MTTFDKFVYFTGGACLALMLVVGLLAVIATIEGISGGFVAIRRTHICIGQWYICWYRYMYLRRYGFVLLTEAKAGRKSWKLLGITIFKLNH